MNGGPTNRTMSAVAAILDAAILPADAEAAIRALVDENDSLRAQLRVADRLELELRNEAREDPLTGLLNRRAFDGELNRAVDLARRYNAVISLLFIDLDEFKKVNDEHGHAVGDMALTHVAALLTSHVRRSDVVARVGGDEFALLLWQTDNRMAQSKAKALSGLIAGNPLSREHYSLALGASIGATEIADTDDDASAVLARADKAMYAAKHARA